VAVNGAAGGLGVGGTAVTGTGSPPGSLDLLKYDHKRVVSELRKPLLSTQLKEKLTQTTTAAASAAATGTGSGVSLAKISEHTAALASIRKPPPLQQPSQHAGLTRVQADDLSSSNLDDYASFANRSLIINKNNGENDVGLFANFMTSSVNLIENPKGTLLTCKDNGRFYVDSKRDPAATLLADATNKLMVKVSPQLLILNLSKKRVNFEKPINT
jgi:hypothetical protein